MKDTGRLLLYFAATILVGALAAPLLFWTAGWLAHHGIFPRLARFDFETFFHRALLACAILFLWPLLRTLRIRKWRDLDLQENAKWKRDVAVGFLLAAIPLLCCGIILLYYGNYSLRPSVRWGAVGTVALSAAVVPLIEESLFRGLFLGILLRRNRPVVAIALISAIFSIIHFLKAPAATSSNVTWVSGFRSMANAFGQFTQPMLLLAGFTTLVLIGWILAHARVRTRSLWLPIGLHAGWIFASGAFNKIAHRDAIILPWLGKNLLVGIVPLCVGAITWLLMLAWLKYVADPKT